VLLGVTGSVAAIYTTELFGELSAVGYDVKVVATAASLYFFDPARLAPVESGRRNPDVVILDADEWPRERYERGDPVLHIELRRWADLLLIAPLDANTLAKLALGITDNTLTCVYRAWDCSRPIVLAPAMNTLMWEHPATARHLHQVEKDIGKRLRVVPPVTKQLACDDVGLGAMASREAILEACRLAFAGAGER
jgi:phosphopantothenoylcysteine decarboxylase